MNGVVSEKAKGRGIAVRMKRLDSKEHTFFKNLWYVCRPVRTLTAFVILAETTTPQRDFGGGPGILFKLNWTGLDE